MRALRLLLVVASACRPSESGTADTTDTTDTTDTGTTPATTADGSTSDVTGSTAATDGPTSTGTHDTHDTHANSTTADGSTTHSDPPVTDYCNCMLENCHDQYHTLWGEDHQASEAMCKAAAAAVPSVGVPAMSGDSLECRLHFCTIGRDDPAACASALGAAPCPLDTSPPTSKPGDPRTRARRNQVRDTTP